jgi:hypothetical protein
VLWEISSEDREGRSEFASSGGDCRKIWVISKSEKAVIAIL